MIFSSARCTACSGSGSRSAPTARSKAPSTPTSCGLIPEVEAWVAGLREIDEKLRTERAADEAEALGRLEAELAALRRRLNVRTIQATSG